MSVLPNLQTLMEDDVFREEEDYNIEETTVSHQRWKYLLCRLINAISNQQHPLALYLDGKDTLLQHFYFMHQRHPTHLHFCCTGLLDLHWCDEVTLGKNLAFSVINPLHLHITLIEIDAVFTLLGICRYDSKCSNGPRHPPLSVPCELPPQ